VVEEHKGEWVVAQVAGHRAAGGKAPEGSSTNGRWGRNVGAAYAGVGVFVGMRWKLENRRVSGR